MLNPRARCTRSGLSLVELLVALVLFGVIAATLTAVVARQYRLYGDSIRVMEMRANLRQAAEILPSELRVLSARRGDIYAMSPSFVEFRAHLGSAVLCDIDASRTRLTTPSLNTSARNGTSAWLQPPQAGDSLLIYDRSAAGVPDSSWRALALSAAPTSGTCPTFASTPAEAAAGYTLLLASAVAPGVSLGASIRFFRRSRYELYDASDGLGYLGFSDCLSTRSPACSIRQPVSGPYLALSSTPPGLVLSYVDSANTPSSDPRRVARFDVTARARARGSIGTVGRRTGSYTDSLIFRITVRN